MIDSFIVKDFQIILWSDVGFYINPKPDDIFKPIKSSYINYIF